MMAIRDWLPSGEDPKDAAKQERKRFLIKQLEDARTKFAADEGAFRASKSKEEEPVQVGFPAIRKWYVRNDDGSFSEYNSEMVAKGDIKPTDDQEMESLFDMLQKLNQTIISIKETRKIDIRAHVKDNGLITLQGDKSWRSGGR